VGHSHRSLRRLFLASSLVILGALPQQRILASTPTTPAGNSTPPPSRLSLTLSSNVITVAGEVRARVQVNPHEDNRMMRVVLDGPLYYASTDVQLDGADAARTHDIWWQALPPGTYTVTVTVDCAKGSRLYDRKELRVVGFTGQESEP
jgi:hypothetical protein